MTKQTSVSETSLKDNLKILTASTLLFFSCNTLFADLHTDSQKAKQVATALKFVGQIKDSDVKEIDGMTSIFPMGLLYMIDPLVHRQGSPEPMKRALPGPGFNTLEEMTGIMKKNPNADVLPKTSTKFWSKELKAKLIPVLEQEGIGVKNGEDRLLTASQILEMLSLSRLSNAPPIPGENTSKRVKISQADWQEIRDQIGELAISYQRAIQSGKTQSVDKKGTHR